MGFTAAQIAKGHSPESRRKAVETMRRNRTGIFKPRAKKAKKANGTTSLIDVSSLPSRPRRRSVARKAKRTIYSPEERTRIVAKVRALLATGQTIKDASAKVGVHDTQYRTWVKHPKRWLTVTKLNGVHHAAVAGDATVRIVVRIAGEDRPITIQDAISLRTDLDALLGTRA